MSALAGAIAMLVDFFEANGVAYMLIGGIANLVHGQPRATFDVDAAVLVAENDWPRLIGELRKTFEVIPKEPLAFLQETHVLPVQTGQNVRIDLIWARLPYELRAIARATKEDVAGRPVRICRAEDLVIYKIVSERSKDREDVQAVIRRQQARLDRPYLRRHVRALAAALDRPDLVAFLEECLARAGRSARPEQ